MAVNPELLLFIEPENKPSEKPVLDELTRKLAASFRKAKTGAIMRYSVIGEGYEFQEGNGWCGIHECSCGVCSGAIDYLLPNGEMTNGNCIHYMAYHREEIPQEQLDRIANLKDGMECPRVQEIKIPEENRKEKKPMTREEYLEKTEKK